MRRETAFTIDLVVTQDCAPAVAKGVARLFESVTIQHPSEPGQRCRHPSFSLTSRRYSIWSHLREHLDGPVADLIQRSRGICEFRLLEDFAPSTAGKRPPTFVFDVQALKKAQLSGNPVNALMTLRPSLKGQPEGRTDRLVANLEIWDRNLRTAIQSAPAQPMSKRAAMVATRFISTMQTVRNLLSLLHLFRAERGSDPFQVHDGVHPQLRDNKTRHQGQSFCELCWRPTMRSAAMGRRSRTPDVRSRQLSNRFCAEHDPSDPKSQYRVDLRYKKVFQQECLFGTRLSVLEGTSPPSFESQEEHRLAAYKRAHSGLRPLSKADIPSLREQAWDLALKGVRQADIARQLGVSRQSVFRTLKRTREILATLNDRHSKTHEKDRQGQQSMLADAVASLFEEGFTPREIIQVLDAPTDLVLSAIHQHEALQAKRML